jgi:hypothetical protein
MAPAAFDAEAGATNGNGAKPGLTAVADSADAGAAFVLESKGTHACSPTSRELVAGRRTDRRIRSSVDL